MLIDTQSQEYKNAYQDYLDPKWFPKPTMKDRDDAARWARIQTGQNNL